MVSDAMNILGFLTENKVDGVGQELPLSAFVALGLILIENNNKDIQAQALKLLKMIQQNGQKVNLFVKNLIFLENGSQILLDTTSDHYSKLEVLYVFKKLAKKGKLLTKNCFDGLEYIIKHSNDEELKLNALEVTHLSTRNGQALQKGIKLNLESYIIQQVAEQF